VARLVADAFEGFAGSGGHPCLGARSVVRRQAYSMGLFERLGTESAATALNVELGRFAARLEPGELSSFVAAFREPTAMAEPEFSRLLWRQLQLMHEDDRAEHSWDASVSADPGDAHFSFSVGGRAYFVVGLHAGSSRWARRFAWPTLVFNPHEQFVSMRREGRYDRMRAMIRDRDADLQGDINPVLRDHGTESEARQYAGDAVAPDWRCPLHVVEEQ
jgi:FPC/CPF motif-containing protein YcgG